MIYRMDSTRKAAGQGIVDLYLRGEDVVAVSADTCKSMYTTLLQEHAPERFIDVGIAEQNMMMVGAGLASTGKTVFVASYSVFTSMRCCEQVRTFIAYPELNVNIIGGIGGFSAGIEGVTHVATEDLGIMRCLAKLAVMAPSDAVATRKAVVAAASYPGPTYIRVGRDPSPVLFDDDYVFEIGKPIVHRKGKDLTLIACGLILVEAFEAARQLEAEGIDAGVIEVHTLSPVTYPELIRDEALKTGQVITIEEHNIVGGLGTVVQELLCGAGKLEVRKLGLPGCYAESGTPEELVKKYGIDAVNIAAVAKKMLG